MATTLVITIGCILIGLIIGFDIWFSIDTVPGNTWSEIIRRFAKTTPFIPFVCGVLSGHFFWPQSLKEYIPLLGQPSSVALLIWCGVVISMIGLTFTKMGMTFPLWIGFLVGIVGGTFLWPVGRW